MAVRRLCTALALAGTVAIASGCAAHASVPKPRPSPVRAAVTAHAGPPWTAADRAELRARLDDVLADPLLREKLGIAVVSQDGALLFGRRERTPKAPASTLKVVVAYSALETLGPSYRFATSFDALDRPDADGTLHSDLWLVGGGDPTLTTDQLRAGIRELARAGIRKIDGDLIVDASAFSGPEQNPAWALEDLEYGYGAGTSAISLDGDTAEFRIDPTTIGAPARVRVIPRNPSVTVTGTIMTAYSSMLSIERSPASNHFTIGGQIASGIEQKYWRPIIDIPHYVGGAVGELLRDRGIALSGETKTGVVPFAAHSLWTHRSEPLATLLRTMLVQSDNHIAEQLLRTLGAQRGAGTEASGAGVERSVIARSGISVVGLRIVDGSGLAASDAVTPLILASLLARAQHERIGSVFYNDLPRVGVEGTVRNYPLSAAAGRVRAKSGHIGGVNALTGYVTTRRHGRVTFSIIVNDRNADAGSVDDGIVRTLDTLAVR